jgi:sortase (surface protein transpeptidase)
MGAHASGDPGYAHSSMRFRPTALILGLALVLTACGPRFALEHSGPQTVAQAGTVEPVAEAPTDLAIPRIGVRSELIDLGLQEDRSVEVPEDPQIAGWYTGGPKPGEVGPAAIIGHVDSHTGAGIFHRLRELRPGDDVHVRRADGSVVSFVVQGIEKHPKDEFPTERVYGNTDTPQLRLITCGGTFDRSERSYTDNIVVYAQLAA